MRVGERVRKRERKREREGEGRGKREREYFIITFKLISYFTTDFFNLMELIETYIQVYPLVFHLLVKTDSKPNLSVPLLPLLRRNRSDLRTRIREKKKRG